MLIFVRGNSYLWVMNKLKTLREEVRNVLTQNILPFWIDNMQDVERGGWYGRMTGRGELVPDAPRGAVLYARLLWTFSAAYRVLAGVEGGAAYKRLLEAATMTKDYILAHFVDEEYGGTYWSVTADGTPLDTKKQFYAQGFMLYGFAEYARATGDEEALKMAQQLFDVIEQHAWDGEHGGYIEACTRDWQPIEDMRLSAKDDNYPKSQNTHLHIIEPYANLLRGWPTPSPSPARLEETLDPSRREGDSSPLAGAVARLIELFCTRILNPATHHLDLFFDMDWRRMSRTESYGHDIECSWLLHEAALALGDAEVLRRVEPVVRAVAVASEKGLRESLTPRPSPKGEGSLFLCELGEREGLQEQSPVEAVWWVQAEAVVGFFNIYQHFGDEAALDKALRVWEYIKEHLIDREHGEWYWSVREDGSVNLDDDHAGFWKCPYHNSRMCLELIERIDAMLAT